MPLLEPKEVTCPTVNGEERHYRIGKYTAITGREIITQYPILSVLSGKDYQASESLMLKLMAHVEVVTKNDAGEEVTLQLVNKALVDNHVPDWQVLMKLEFLSLEYNTGFFENGKAFHFLQGLGQKALPRVIEILTPLLDKLSPVVKQHFKS